MTAPQANWCCMWPLLGDVGYADGAASHWDAFLNKIEAIASSVPYMVNPG